MGVSKPLHPFSTREPHRLSIGRLMFHLPVPRALQTPGPNSNPGGAFRGSFFWGAGLLPGKGHSTILSFWNPGSNTHHCVMLGSLHLSLLTCIMGTLTVPTCRPWRTKRFGASYTARLLEGLQRGNPPDPSGIVAGSGVRRMSWSHLNEAFACPLRPLKDILPLLQTSAQWVG